MNVLNFSISYFHYCFSSIQTCVGSLVLAPSSFTSHVLPERQLSFASNTFLVFQFNSAYAFVVLGILKKYQVSSSPITASIVFIIMLLECSVPSGAPTKLKFTSAAILPANDQS